MGRGEQLTTLAEVMADLRMETAVLDGVLSKLDEAGWHRETPAVGWDTHDTVAHLADTNDVMFDSITSGSRDLTTEISSLAQNREAWVSDPDAVNLFTAEQVERGRKMEWEAVYAWWRSSCARLHETIEALDPAGRYQWGPNMISPLSLSSARMMETWAHSLDIHEAAGVDYEQTDRLAHIAFLGLRALAYAFNLEGVDPPGPVRLELTLPSGAEWSGGPRGAPTVIRGSAVDWCRIVTRRDRDGAAGRLQTEGPDGEHVIKYGRAFL